mgnify:CR=1 FL=1
MSDQEKVRVFHNSYKTADKHPDFSNKGVSVFGESMDVAVWKNQDKNGNDYLNIQFDPAYEGTNQESSKPKEGSNEPLPF